MRKVLLLLLGVSGVFAAVACGSSGDTAVVGATFFTGADGSSGTLSGGGPGSGGSGGGLVLTTNASGSGGGKCSKATTCEEQKADCGEIPDGCGSVLKCGTGCPAGQVCGGGGKANMCGTSTVCKAKTCADLGANCGPAGDGCGKELDCGTCTAPEVCGGGGVSSVCGTGTTCVPKTCVEQAVNCGPVSDGCGKILQCGDCTGNQTCGGGGVGSVCGAPQCIAKTCADLGTNCGPVGDGCGGLLQCGSCSQPEVCGGKTASVCGIPSTCTNLCLQQVTCSNPAVTTTLTGKVFAPNGVDPLLNALVYVPNAPVSAFTPGVSCDQCSAEALGAPLVSAASAVDGSFTLTNVPVGAKIPLVIQLGRWRRQVTIPNVPSCVTTAVPATLTRLPRNKSEGDIPLMAFSTGAVDTLECVMRKIGVDDTEFTAPGSNGRIHLYAGLEDPNSQAAGGAKFATSPNEDQLWGSQAALNQYDMLLFPCQSDQTTRTAATQQRLINYANAGGRVFATHFSYVWLYNDAPFSSTAMWHVEQHPSPADQTGFVDTSFPKGQALAQWLSIVNASTAFGQIPLQVIRHDHDAVVAPSQSWMTINDVNFPDAIVHYTFNTPVNAPPAQQCGRVLFDDFHVENVKNSKNMIFPAECLAGDMSAQEKLLEFMIFDLASCVTPDVPSCQPKKCTDLGIECGPAGDGCGNLIQCGACVGSETCGGGGVPSVCGVSTCTPKTCASLGIQCGPAGDGCGALIECGACPSGQTCGGGGQPSVCGLSTTCVAQTCEQLGVQCGPAGDGCGKLLTCGTCDAPASCGGGGMPGVCGAPTCTPKTCMEVGANCGPVSDGCGSVLSCGTCASPQTCGGGGKPSVCGGSGPK